MSDSPGRFQNVTDNNLKTNKPIDDVDMLKLLGNQQHNYELVTNTAAGENQIVHGHSHGELNGGPEDGFTDYRSIWESTFQSGTDNGYAVAITTGLANIGIPMRANVGPFKRFVTQVYAKVSRTASPARLRIERWNWNDSSADTDDGGTYGTNALQETAATVTGTSFRWHTIDGQKWDATTSTFSGLATKLCVLTGPTGVTTLHEVGANAGFRLCAASGAATGLITIGAIVILPAKTTDEGTGEIWS